MGRSCMSRLLEDDSAQGVVEYALIIALIAMVAVAALRIFGKRVNTTLRSAVKGLK